MSSDSKSRWLLRHWATLRGNGERAGGSANYSSSHEAGPLPLVYDGLANSCIQGGSDWEQRLQTAAGRAQRMDGTRRTKGITGTRRGRLRNSCWLVRKVVVTLLRRSTTTTEGRKVLMSLYTSFDGQQRGFARESKIGLWGIHQGRLLEGIPLLHRFHVLEEACS